ncbi:MAG: hypothetical protein FJ029_09010, partial [Actinobacteria bacterium]|nr:hypothetical protein [Actinomycetota bacterium]
SYNGTPVRWDPRRYDTAAMPFVVAVKQNFWAWRICGFDTGSGYLRVEVELPSAMPDGLRMISFEEGDVGPEAAHAELAELLSAMGHVLLDTPWRYTLTMSDGQRTAEFTGAFGGGA